MTVLIEVGVEVEVSKISLSVDGETFVMAPASANQLAIDLITANDLIVAHQKKLADAEDAEDDDGRDTPPQVS